MDLTREKELTLFRNVNGKHKKWSTRGSRVSYMESNQIRYLRENQGKSKAKLIRFIMNTGIDKEFWVE